MTFLLSNEGFKRGLVSNNLMFLKYSFTLLAANRKKKVNQFLVFVKFGIRFVDIRNILDNYNSHGLALKKYTNLNNFFSVINGFHVFGNIFFPKNIKCYLFLSVTLFSFLVYLLPCLINEKSRITLSVVIESATEFCLP